MIEGKTKLQKFGGSIVFIVPPEIACDSAFPLSLNEDAVIAIEDSELKIKKARA